MKQAMVFAAGLGTRLRPLTETKPKALIRVGGEPLLKHVLLRLRDAGFTEVVINVHHFSRQIIDYLDKNDNFGIHIKISDESAQLLNTGGGLYYARKLFSPQVPILLHNVDIMSNVNLSSFYEIASEVTPIAHSKQVPGALLLVSKRKTKRYLLFNEKRLLRGWINIETGEVKSPYVHIRESSATDLQSHYEMLAFSGIHCLSPQLFTYMDAYHGNFSIIDFYLDVCSKVTIKGHWMDNLKLIDVGKLETLEEAELFIESL